MGEGAAHAPSWIRSAASSIEGLLRALARRASWQGAPVDVPAWQPHGATSGPGSLGMVLCRMRGRPSQPQSDGLSGVRGGKAGWP
eukprot:13223947-Alexandrium_andersonii.AAC.1